MQRVFLLTILILGSLAAFAEEVLGPAHYLKILADSKLTYKMLSEPSKTPADAARCGRRDESMRIVMRDGKKALVPWPLAPEVKKLLDEGESLYQSGKHAEAGEKFKAAIAADPNVAASYFFYGDALLFGSKDAEGALAQYRKGIALDPTLPSGHFFASSALSYLGRYDEAREEVIQALTFYPGYEVIWKIAERQPERWNAKPVVRHKFEPPAGYLGKKTDKGIDIYGGADGQWLGYALCKAVWANEPKFRKERPNASTEIERACVLNQISSQYNRTHAQLEKEKKKTGKAEIVAAMPELERHLVDVAESQLLDGYILFEIMGQQCPLPLSMAGEDALKQIDGYIRKYVIVGK